MVCHPIRHTGSACSHGRSLLLACAMVKASQRFGVAPPQINQACGANEAQRAAVALRASDGLVLADAFAPARAKSKRSELATSDTESRPLETEIRINWLKQAVNVNHVPYASATTNNLGAGVAGQVVGALTGFASHGSNVVGVGVEIASSAGAAAASRSGFRGGDRSCGGTG